eukprot:scaffold225326_cov53-Attheya_sp.AAC.3
MENGSAYLHWKREQNAQATIEPEGHRKVRLVSKQPCQKKENQRRRNEFGPASFGSIQTPFSSAFECRGSWTHFSRLST